MREIKFKALKKKFLSGVGNGLRWVYGYPVEIGVPNKDTVILEVGHYGERWQCELDSLSEFTGLEDFSGNYIYENDLLSSIQTGHTFNVIFHDGAYECHDTSDESFSFYLNSHQIQKYRLVVIGNTKG